MEGEEGRREEWKVTANGHRICFGADESILKLIMKIIMQLCKWLNCMVCKLYSNKDVILKIASPIPSVQVKMWILSYVNYISTKQLLQMEEKRTSLAVQWLRLWSSNTGVEKETGIYSQLIQVSLGARQIGSETAVTGGKAGPPPRNLQSAHLGSWLTVPLHFTFPLGWEGHQQGFHETYSFSLLFKMETRVPHNRRRASKVRKNSSLVSSPPSIIHARTQPADDHKQNEQVRTLS